jgi:hypothetical protein
MEFAIDMDLAGTEQLSVAPVGDSNHVELSSTWRSPLFAGRFLPRTREVGGNGYSAAWDVSSLATGTQLGGYLRHWQSETMYAKPMDWIFASTKLKGAQPRCGSIASHTYLYPAAVKAGVFDCIEERHPSRKLIRVRYIDPSGRPIKRGASIS